ncbi:LOW QUALITY PROTEIN: DDE_4 domain-containing protein, partial [Cephalotus follicularis]
ITTTDGTLVHAIIPTSQQMVYRGRGKGKCYQNVLGICDFNMIFTFVYAGWEGVAHDSRVLTEVMAESSNNFSFPPPNYYLCNAAYTNTRGFMAPYRNVRYWLGDFRRRRAITKEEKFNHAHAKLRNIIERAYGVLKSRFSIFDKMAPYPFNVQRNVVIACFAVNNFIRKEKINDELFAQYE